MKKLFPALLFLMVTVQAQMIVGNAQVSGNVVMGATSTVVACQGVTGNGSTDDTTAVQACLDALTSNHALVIPAGMNMKITSTLNFHTRRGTVIAGMQGTSSALTTGTAAPKFVWQGSDGGTVWSIQDCSGCIFENFDVYSGPTPSTITTTGADVLMDVDQSGSPTITMTDSQWIGIGLYGVTRRTTVKLIQFSATSGSNVEKMTISGHSTLSCSDNGKVGIGIDNSVSGNALKHLYLDNTIEFCATGVNLANGSGDVIHNQLQSNAVAVHASGSYGDHISDNDMENNSQCAIVGGPGKKIEGNRCDAVTVPSGHSAIESLDSAFFRVDDNIFGVANPAVAYSAVGCTNAGYVHVSGNYFTGNSDQALTIARLEDCTLGVLLGVNQGFDNSALALVYESLAQNVVTPTAGFAQFAYDVSGKVRLSEGTGALRPILSYVQSSTPPCSAAGDLGNQWFDTTSSVTTIYKVCMEVTSSPAWVTK